MAECSLPLLWEVVDLLSGWGWLIGSYIIGIEISNKFSKQCGEAIRMCVGKRGEG
jgi:hypothetical protein